MSFRILILILICAGGALGAESLTRWDGWPGPIAGELKLPADADGEVPIVTVGSGASRDVVAIRTTAPGHVRLSFSHGRKRVVESEVFELSGVQAHRLVVSVGSLLPPLRSEIYWRQPHLLHLTQHLLVMIDGRVALARPAEFAESRNTPDFSFGGKYFTQVEPAAEDDIAAGVLPLMGRRVVRDTLWRGFPGPVRLIVLPNQGASRERQPLLSTGRLGSGDLIYWTRQEDGRVRIGFWHAGAGAIESEPLALREGAQEILLSAGGLLPPDGDELAAREPLLTRLRGQLFVELNGRIVFSQRAEFHPSRVESVVFGANVVESRPALRYFEGAGESLSALSPEEMIEASARVVARTGALSTASAGWPGPVKMRVKLPTDRAGVAEPLLCSGRTGAADLLVVRYVDARHVRIAFDHWGVGGPVSDPIEIEPGATQEIAASFGALYPPADSAFFAGQPALRARRDEVRITLNGRVVLAAGARSHPSAPEKILFGQNPVGASSCVPEFSGTLVKIQGAPEMLDSPAK